MNFTNLIASNLIICISCTLLAADDNQNSDDPNQEGTKSKTLDNQKYTPQQQKFANAIQGHFKNLKGFESPTNDYFVVGEAKGLSARFVVVQGTEAATSLIVKIVSESPQSQWKVFGRASTVEGGKKVMASARSQFSRQMRARLKQCLS